MKHFLSILPRSTGVKSTAISLVPPEHAIRMPPRRALQAATPFARITSRSIPLYQGDTAILVEQNMSSRTAELLVIPRLGQASRPPQALFNPDQVVASAMGFAGQTFEEAEASEMRQAPQHVGEQTWTFLDRTYVSGLEKIHLPFEAFLLDAEPSVVEQRFITAAHGQGTPPSLAGEALHSAITAILNQPVLSFSEGDYVRVHSGQCTGFEGQVLSVESTSALVGSLNGGLPMLILLTEMERLIRVGDHVRVRRGQHTGRVGDVLRVCDGEVDILARDTAPRDSQEGAQVRI